MIYILLGLVVILVVMNIVQLTKSSSKSNDMEKTIKLFSDTLATGQNRSAMCKAKGFRSFQHSFLKIRKHYIKH